MPQTSPINWMTISLIIICVVASNTLNISIVSNENNLSKNTSTNTQKIWSW